MARFTVNMSIIIFFFKVCSVVRGDNSDLGSIKSAALAISELTKKVDCLFMNAGTMGSCSLDLGNVMRSLLAPWELPYRFATGDGLIKYSSSKTADGMLLYHFIQKKNITTSRRNPPKAKVYFMFWNQYLSDTFSARSINSPAASSEKFLLNRACLMVLTEIISLVF